MVLFSHAVGFSSGHLPGPAEPLRGHSPLSKGRADADQSQRSGGLGPNDGCIVDYIDIDRRHGFVREIPKDTLAENVEPRRWWKG